MCFELTSFNNPFIRVALVDDHKGVAEGFERFINESENARVVGKAKQSRIEWIDSAKGIGILCVVFAHICANGYIADFIYLFHMPLFFFIGGYLYKPTDDYKGYFVKKVKHLLIPYFVFLVILQFGEMLTPSYNDKIYTHIYNSIYGGRLLSGWTGVFWFITCFFLSQQIFSLIMRVKRPYIKYIMFALLLFAYINYLYMPDMLFPWSVNNILYTVPIFYFGYIFRDMENRINKRLLLVTILVVIVAVSLYFYPSMQIRIKETLYGVPYISFASGILIIVSVIMFSKYISQYRWSSIIQYIGRAAIVIMYLHQFVQICVSQAFTENIVVRFTLAVLIPLITFYIFSKYKIMRRLFLGIS